MEPVTSEYRKTGSAATLRYFALMVGKDVVFAARVDVNLITEQHARHSAAFNMPTGVALAPWGGPAHEVFGIRLPEQKVSRMALDCLMGRINTVTGAFAQLIERVS